MATAKQVVERQTGEAMESDSTAAQGSGRGASDIEVENEGGVAALCLILDGAILASKRDPGLLFLFAQGLAMGLAIHEADPAVATHVMQALHLSTDEHERLKKAIDAVRRRYQHPTE